ncbi:LysR family transcriptional regulator [Kerstersia gyiorum]|uniref:LysR family transcriptional regulator n=1 Tax=Kerstersia gyiorum TaxID=206506 RepID=UPI00124722B2|nr:LysR family transcriptional regulator [Kerstersia gyiorum]KAB0545036.1 LysR family transcriptional regulator [Kerstersia gyiorum]
MEKNFLAQVTDFDLRMLLVFRTVAEYGGFAAAESALGITRSAISQHMSDLEKRLGMRLCQRGRAGFALTDQGREILRASEALLASIEDFRREVNLLHNHLRGELNLGLMNNLVTQTRTRITNTLRDLRRQSDGIRINISMSTPGDIERGLLDGRLHIGALPDITPLSGLEYLPLYDEISLLYCSHLHPLAQTGGQATLAQIQQAGTVAPGYRMTAEALRLHQDLNCVARATDREGIAFLILTGEYIGFLPCHYAATWVEKGLMVALQPERMQFTVPLAIATRKGRRSNLLVEHFLTTLSNDGQSPR